MSNLIIIGDRNSTASVTCIDNSNLIPDSDCTEPTSIYNHRCRDTFSYTVTINHLDEDLIKELKKNELKLKARSGWFNPKKINTNYKPSPKIIKAKIRNTLPKSYKQLNTTKYNKKVNNKGVGTLNR